MVQIKISPDFKVVADGVRNLSTNLLSRVINDTSQRVADLVEIHTKAETPVKTGRGRDSVEAHVEQSSRGRSARIVMTGDPHLRFALRGTRPHIIRPSSGRILAWLNPAGGIVFARSVNHPGQSPNPFVDRAWSKAEPQVRQTLRDAGLRGWRELSRFR